LVPILAYHSLDSSGSVLSVAPEVFRRQMVILRERGFHGIGLGHLLSGWQGRRDLPRRPVVLTFDDGFRSVLEEAVPVLTELGFSATIFVVAGYCGGTNDWPSQPPALPRLPLLSWADLRALGAAGLEIGAHGLTHAPLTHLSAREAGREIVGSKAILEEKLGRPVVTFAYPYGLAGRAHRDLAATHYRGACGVTLRRARFKDDRCRLPRIEMYYFRRMSCFRILFTPLGRAYLRCRAAGRVCRALARRSFSP
jgi:peptidoglycan/xylan/chitin deacetylase (PgdA/CDA1 family)